MGRALWIGVKFLSGALIGTVIGATITAYAAGAADPADTGESIVGGIRARLNAAKAAGDAAAMQTEAALTQQFRTNVHDSNALNPPTALHPQM